MDHSVRGYLSRQPTQILQMLLQQYLQRGMEGYYNAIPIIAEILTQRGIGIPQEIHTRIAEIQKLGIGLWNG